MFLTAINFWQRLVQLDQAFFLKINREWINSFFDSIMPLLRMPAIWVPLYVFLFMLVITNFKTKGLWWIVLFISTVAFTDMTGNYVFKHGIERLRPCNDPDFYLYVRLLVKQCGAGYSFVSNHAANHFGMATFFIVTCRHIFKKWVWIAFVWAAAIAYAQVYVGIHYPLDVFCGALLGLAFGISMGSIFNKHFGFAIFDHQQSL